MQHIEFDDFGEYTETIDLVPVAIPQRGDCMVTSCMSRIKRAS